MESEKNEIQNHVFHYDTHSMLVEIRYFVPRRPEVKSMPDSVEYDRNGDPYCRGTDYFSERERAEKYAGYVGVYDAPKVIVHERGSEPAHIHSWVAGIMRVHEEDLASVVAVRDVGCETCPAVIYKGSQV